MENPLKYSSFRLLSVSILFLILSLVCVNYHLESYNALGALIIVAISYIGFIASVYQDR